MTPLSLLLIVACAAPAAPAAEYEDKRITDMPHVRQRPDFCGEACLEMALSRLGSPLDQNDVFALTGLDPKLGRGAWTRELDVATRKAGFDPGEVWHRVPAGDKEALEAQWAALHADLVQDIPTIVCMHYDASPNTTEHFRLVTGYDAKRDQVIFNDPAVDDGRSMHMARKRFLSLWPLKYQEQTWTVIRLPLAPKSVAMKDPGDTGISEADLAQHVRALKEDLPDGFTLFVQSPFVVMGNESPERVELRTQRTVKWASEALQSAYFDEELGEIWDVWLFKDADTYEHYAWKLFGDRPDTPYGYASGADRALVMNIGTGGGTLIHEIVHPYMAENFEAAPSWFNEGLASLYEQTGNKDGAIIGLPNWRLDGLQAAILADEVPPFEDLMSTTTDEFYNSDPGTNYSQARYLCHYLQDHKKLRRFYRAFLANHEADPTGVETLKKVLGTQDLQAFKSDWQDWVMSLER